MPKKTQYEYLHRYGRCPVCDADAVAGGHVDIETGAASQKVWCNECHAVWLDSYTLCGYQLLEEGTP